MSGDGWILLGSCLIGMGVLLLTLTQVILYRWIIAFREE